MRLLASFLFLLFSFTAFSQFPLDAIGSPIQASVANGLMGESIDLNRDGKVIAVGTARTFEGFVQVFGLSNANSWRQRGSNIEGSGGMFGRVVSIDNAGGRVAIGAFMGLDSAGLNTGYVEVYDYDGTDWSQTGETLYGLKADQEFGKSLNISGDGTTLVVGSPNFNGGFQKQEAGKTQVFRLNNEGNWVQLGSDLLGGALQNHMGSDVDLSYDGNVMVSSEDGYTEGSTLLDIGRVRAYEFKNGDWDQLGEDMVGRVSLDKLGLSLSVSADGKIISASEVGANAVAIGKVVVFQLIGGNWERMGNDIVGTQVGSGFGEDIEIDSLGLNIIVGDERKDSPFRFAGEVTTYNFSNGQWSESGFRTRGLHPADQYGRGVSISADGGVIAASAPLNEDKFPFGGQVRIHRLQEITSIFGNSKPQSNHKLYPSPAQNELNLVLGSPITGTFSINVVSVSGEIIKSYEIVSFHEGASRIDLSDLQNGVYLLAVHTAVENFHLPFLKE